jgi:type VI secretion system protein ImpL
VRLLIHGTEVTYAHGPIRPTNVRWPGQDNVAQARLAFHPPPSESPGGVTVNGPWAWFRLLDKADVEAEASPDIMTVTFSLEPHTATFELRVDSVENPFSLDELRSFSCPPRL